MIVEKVLVRKAAPEVRPPDLHLIVTLSGGRFEAIPVHLGQHPRSLAYNLIDLAERLMRLSNEEFEKGGQVDHGKRTEQS